MYAKIGGIMITALIFCTAPATGKDLYKDRTASPEQRTADLIARMTLQEKVAQLAGRGIGNTAFGDMSAKIFGTSGNDRLGIPRLVMGHGITGVRSGRDQNVHATYMMTPIGIAATWDPQLYSQASAAVAKEMVALHQNQNLGTTVNIIRHPLGGRNWECFSEDPYLTARLAVANVKAMQSNGIISTPKHFVVNNQEYHRFDINNMVDERTLREIYLPAFKAAITEGGALSIMAAYNRVNGKFMCEHRRLLTEVLRKEWGFKGFVVSDFSRAVHSTIPSARAGLNIEMHSPKFYGENLFKAVQFGPLQETVIDQLLSQKLRVMFKMGIFDRIHQQPKSIVHSDAHQALALEVARESPILLKNEDNILPLDPTSLQRLAVIGPNAKRFTGIPYAYYLQGGGSARCYYFPGAVNDPFEEIKRMAGGIEVLYAQGCTPPTDRQHPNGDQVTREKDRAMIQQAVEVAESADAVVLVVGLNGAVEGESADRVQARLPGGQPELIKRVSVANPNTIVLLITGSYVEAADWINDIKGLILCFYNGEKLSQAMAEVLFGKVCPGGKLPISYPESVDQYPASALYTGGPYSETGDSNVYAEGIFVGYRYFDRHNQKMLFPFGYGLSYTTFEYRNLKISKNGGVRVTVTIKNTGLVPGDEIVQLYVHDKRARIPRPVRELKGFRRVSLLPGESKSVTFLLKDDAFTYWSPQERSWVLEPGAFEIQVGGNSRDIRLHGSLIFGQK